MLRRIYAALMIVLTMFGGTYAPQQTAPNPSDTSNETAKQASVQASDNPLATLSQSEAEEIALKSLGITRSDVRMDRTELDWEKGQAIWEVEIYYGNTEYDFEINALTGEILRTDVEPTERPDTDVVITPTPILPSDPSPDTTELTKEQALGIALDNLGITQDKISKLKIEKDLDDEITVYDIEFHTETAEYDYTIHALTGKILEKEIDVKKTIVTPAPDSTPTPTPTPEPTPTPVTPPEPVTKEITKDDAVAIALEHAGLIASEVKRLKVEKDYEKGTLVYEIEFEKGAWEYEFEIRVSDGKILEWDKEIDD